MKNSLYFRYTMIRYDVSEFFSYRLKFIRSRVRLFWSRLYVRKNEFHWSLYLDMELWETMNKEQQGRYMGDLVRRRNIAHKREMKETDRKAASTG